LRIFTIGNLYLNISVHPQNPQSNLELGYHDYEGIILITKHKTTLKIFGRTWAAMVAQAFDRLDKKQDVKKEPNA